MGCICTPSSPGPSTDRCYSPCVAGQSRPCRTAGIAPGRSDPIRSSLLVLFLSLLFRWDRMGSDGIHPTVHRSSPTRWCGPNAPSPPVRQTQGVHHQYGVEPTTMEATATKPTHVQGMTNVPTNDPWTSGDATERHKCEETHPKRGTSGRNHVDEWTEDVATKTNGNEGKERHHKTMHVGTAMDQCMETLAMGEYRMNACLRKRETAWKETTEGNGSVTDARWRHEATCKVPNLFEWNDFEDRTEGELERRRTRPG